MKEDMKLNSKVLSDLKILMFVLDKMTDQENNYADDYRVALCRTAVITQKPIVVRILNSCKCILTSL